MQAAGRRKPCPPGGRHGLSCLAGGLPEVLSTHLHLRWSFAQFWGGWPTSVLPLPRTMSWGLGAQGCRKWEKDTWGRVSVCCPRLRPRPCAHVTPSEPHFPLPGGGCQSRQEAQQEDVPDFLLLPKRAATWLSGTGAADLSLHVGGRPGGLSSFPRWPRLRSSLGLPSAPSGGRAQVQVRFLQVRGWVPGNS